MKPFTPDPLNLLRALLLLSLAMPSAGATYNKAGPAVISCTLSFPDAVAADPNTIYIPFRLVGRLIAVEARVDTVVGTFFLDTGAERLLLNKNYFDGDYFLQGLTAVGNTGFVDSVMHKDVDTLHWDILTFTALRANVLDLSHIEDTKKLKLIGMIGYEVLKDFEIFLDFQAKRIMLSRLDKKGNRIDADVLPEIPYDSVAFRMQNHIIVLDIDLDGTPLKFGLDTGAELNLLDRLVKKKVLKHFKVLKRVNLRGAGSKGVEVLAGVLYEVKCGNQRNNGMRTMLTNLDDINNAFGTKLNGIMGYEFLLPRRTLINYKKKKLFFFELQRP